MKNAMCRGVKIVMTVSSARPLFMVVRKHIINDVKKRQVDARC